MKNKILYLFSILLTLSSFNFSFAAESRLVKVGAFNNYPVIFQDTDGVFKGLYVDLLKEIGARENIKFEYVLGTWSEGLDRIKTGEVDLLTSVGHTAERSLFMNYTQNPILTVWGDVYAPKSSDLSSILEISDKTIGIMSGDINAKNFQERVSNFDINCKFVEFSNYDDVFKAVSEKGVDAGVAGITFGAANATKYGLKSTGIVFGPLNLYFTTTKDKNQDVILILDKYLSEWKNQENSILDQAKQKWLYGSVGAIAVTPLWLKEFLIILGIGFLVAIAFIVLLKYQIKKATEKILQREESLKESNELLSSYIKKSPIYTFIKSVTPKESRVIIASRNYNTMIGGPERDISGKTMFELFPSEFAKKITDDDWNIVSSGKAVTLEEDFNGRNYTTTKFPIFQKDRNLIAGYTIDITEHKKAEDKIKQSLEEVEKLNRFMVGREVKMSEIKEENEKLKERLKDCK